MYINDVIENIKKDLKDGYNVLIEGIAGAGKSTILTHLEEVGKKKVIIASPYNSLKNSQLDKFDRLNTSQFSLNITTNAKAYEKHNPRKKGYSASFKGCESTYDLYVFDEIYATEPNTMRRNIKDLIDNKKQVLLLGDPYQSCRFSDRLTSKELKDKGIKRYLITNTLRGDEQNRKAIEFWYNNLNTEKSSIEVVYDFISEFKIPVYNGLPIEDYKSRIGYLDNKVQDDIMKTADYTKYTKREDGEFKTTTKDVPIKKVRDAAVVSQNKRNDLKQYNNVLCFVPDNHFSHITCIGVEIPDDVKYKIVIRLDMINSISDLYTLFTRQKTLNCLEVYIIEKVESQNRFKDIKAIQYDKEEYNVVNNSLFVTEMHPKYFFKINPPEYIWKYNKINVCDEFFTELLNFCDHIKGYTNIIKLGNTQIILNNNVLYAGWPEESQCKYDNEDETKKEDSGEFKEPTKDKCLDFFLDSVSRFPGLVCDPFNIFVEEKDGELEILENKVLVPGKAEMTSLSNNDYKYALDITASYFQMWIQNAHLIGYGEMEEYNDKYPISYFKVTIIDPFDGISIKVLNNFEISFYESQGYEITAKKPLGSRKNLFSDVIDTTFKRDLLINRYVKYGKSRMLQWGTLEKKRFQKVILVKDGVESECILDSKEKSLGYAFIRDIKAIQTMIITAYSNENNAVRIEADAIYFKEKLKHPKLPLKLKLTDYKVYERVEQTNKEIEQQTKEKLNHQEVYETYSTVDLNDWSGGYKVEIKEEKEVIKDKQIIQFEMSGFLPILKAYNKERLLNLNPKRPVICKELFLLLETEKGWEKGYNLDFLSHGMYSKKAAEEYISACKKQKEDNEKKKEESKELTKERQQIKNKIGKKLCSKKTLDAFKKIKSDVEFKGYRCITENIAPIYKKQFKALCKELDMDYDIIFNNK